jgi:tartrate-resistant acid phosphatase type 5
MKVIILGDWGELLLNGQDRVAAAMAAWADVNQPSWIVSTGDNFYPKGIRAWNDPGVNLKWRNKYHVHESLSNIVWMLSVGNHDYGDFEVTPIAVIQMRGVIVTANIA